MCGDTHGSNRRVRKASCLSAKRDRPESVSSRGRCPASAATILVGIRALLAPPDSSQTQPKSLAITSRARDLYATRSRRRGRQKAHITGHGPRYVERRCVQIPDTPL